MRRENKKPNGREVKPKTSNVILIVLGVFILVFTITMIVLFDRHESIPDTLVTAVFGAVFGEAGVMGLIKMVKTKYSEREDSNDDI